MTPAASGMGDRMTGVTNAIVPGLNEPAAGRVASNALTIDVEDYFQVSALAPYIERAQWDTIECRIERNMERILDLLERPGTFL